MHNLKQSSLKIKNKMNSKPYLRLVYERDKESRINICDRVAVSSIQMNLFPERQPNLIVFLSPSGLSETEFVKIFDSVKPKFVVDIRTVPRMDIGTLNRGKVFLMFDEFGSSYIDCSLYGSDSSVVVSSLKVRVNEDWKKVPSTMRNRKLKGAIVGPLVFFVDDEHSSDRLKSMLLAELMQGDSETYEVFDY